MSAARAGPRAARSRRRRARRETRSATAASRTARPTAPGQPPGQGIRAPGRAAKTWATAANQAQEATAGRAAQAAAPGHSGSTSAAASPQIVATGTGGAAITFAGTDHRPTCGWSRISTGAQAAWATRGRASDAASQRGRRRDRAVRAGRSPTRMPAVAATDRAKP